MGMIKHRGDTIGIKNTIRDKNDELLDPTTHSIQVYDPDGTAMLTSPDTNPEYISKGVYEFYYNIPTDAQYGDWSIEWYAAKVEHKETEVFSFTVEKKMGD